MSTEIRYLKSKPIGKVTFRLPPEAAPKAKKVFLVGEFNEWNEKATPMQKLKDGTFKTTLDLEVGKAYHFRYLIDGKTWENDWAAQRYEPTPFAGTENSVVEV
jgi:1,4-alpha-glucan branching enzyme